jgi:hypothetical protein
MTKQPALWSTLEDISFLKAPGQGLTRLGA